MAPPGASGEVDPGHPVSAIVDAMIRWQ